MMVLVVNGRELPHFDCCFLREVERLKSELREKLRNGSRRSGRGWRIRRGVVIVKSEPYPKPKLP